MAKNAKRFFSMLLALAMVFSLAAPAAATEVEEHDHEQAETVEVVETQATEAAAETTEAVEAVAEEAAEETAEEEKTEISLNVSKENITVNMDEIKLDVKFDAATVMVDPETEVDESNPIIISLETELRNITVLDEETGDTVKLTDEQIDELLNMYQQYLDHWAANANVLGVQTPFFLSYNDNGEDGLGIMGEMLVMAGISLDAVRGGYVTYDDLSGMILNFMMGDMMGVQLYGETIKEKRDEVLALVDGDYTEAQKMLIINDWLAHNATFDMSYIMNADQDVDQDGIVDNPDKPMVAENPQQHKYYDVVYDAIYDIYEPQIQATFEQNIIDGLKAQMKQTFYENAIKQGYYDAVYQQAMANAKSTAVEEAREKYYESALETATEDETKKVREAAYNAALEEYPTTDEYKDAYNTALEAEKETYRNSDEGKAAYQTAYDKVVTDHIATEEGKATYDAAYNKAVEDYAATDEGKATYQAAYDEVVKAYYEGEGKEACDAAYDEAYNAKLAEAEVATDPAEEEIAAAKTAGEAARIAKAEEAVGANANTAGDQAVAEAAKEAAEEAGYAAAEAEVKDAAEKAGNDAVDAYIAENQTTIEANAKTTADAGAEDYATAEADEAVKAQAETIKTNAEATANEAADAYIEENQAAIEAEAETAAKADVEAAAQSEADKFMTENKEAIAADPVAFCESAFGVDAAAGIATEWEKFWADCEENGVPGMVAQIKQSLMEQNNMTSEEADAQLSNMGIDPSTDTNPEGRVALEIIVAMQMDTPQQDDMLIKLDENGDPVLDDDGNVTYMTPNEAVEVYAGQAAAGLTEGVLDYWEGSHIGILGDGTGVCLGYTKAFTYLVQSMHPEIYLTSADAALDSDYVYEYEDENGEKQSVPMPGLNWKSPEDLYYNADGNLDITLNYVVDTVRITFDADVTMYGVEQANFNSDHFWNAVQIDGEWFYVDPCYTDVYGEVMMRDRVETDGAMNHLYFLFSDSSARELYDGNYKELKSLYGDGTTDNTSDAYEKGWFAYAKSNVYIADGYAYYLYDTTDMLDLMDQFENNMDNLDIAKLMAGEFKIVKHDLSANDNENVVESLVDFNYEDESADRTYARVNVGGEMVESELLTKLYEKHTEEEDIYPGLNLTAALYGGKIYFNLSNCILSYNLSDGAVAIEKKYETIQGSRDKTNPFGGMAFSVVSEGGDFTVYNRPLAGLTIKDGTMYASVATNFAFISGKADRQDTASEGYGYAYEESNYNPNYSSFTASQNSDEVNDNDEFMWSANFVDTFAVSSLTNPTTEYDFTECDHHYVKFDEVYYTTNDSGEFNTGYCYVCTECNFAIDEPVESEYDDMFGRDYEAELEAFQYAEENYGHTYEATDGAYNEEDGTVSFTHLKCSAICPERYGKVDCLLEDNGEKDYTGSVDATVSGTKGSCTEGLITTYTGSTTVNEGTEEVPKNIKITASADVQGEAGEHAYVVKDGDSKWSYAMDDATGEATDQRIATATITCSACDDVKIEDVKATEIVANTDPEKTYAPTCTEDGADSYIATYKVDDDTVVKEYKSFKIEKLGHSIVEVAAKEATCTEAGNTAHYACEREGCNAKFSDAEGTTEVEASSVVIAATGHSEPLTLVEAKEATCTEDGNSAYYACEQCDMIFEDEAGTTETTLETVTIAKLGHKMTATAAKEVTCTEDGNNAYYTCGNCNKVYKDEKGETETTVAAETIEANGHTFTGKPEFKWADDNTCKAISTCTCGETKTVDCTVTSETEDATCTEAGTITYTASVKVDGETYTDIKVVDGQALGHDYKVTFNWASDYSMATATISCSRGDDEETKNCQIVVTTKEATCTEAGETVYTATATLKGEEYSDVKKESIAMKDHEFTSKASDEIASEATCTASAKYYVQCNNCETVSEEKTVEVGAPNGHSFTDEASAFKYSDATCTEPAYYYVKCDNCGAASSSAEDIVAVGEPNGHSWDEGTVTKKPTAEETGIRTYECTVCGETKEVVIPVQAEVTRVSGNSRYETSFAIAEQLKDVLGVKKFDTIIVASGESYPDALSGSYLSTVKNAPILLTNKSMNSTVLAYIQENLSQNGMVYILGGVNSVTQSFEDSLDEAGIENKRLAGDNRMETNLAILEEAGVNGGKILISTAYNYADTLSASASGLPILLLNTDANKLTDAQKAFLEENSDCELYIVGGVNTVSEKLAAEIEEYGEVKRISGDTREETSIKVASFIENPECVVLAYSRNYPDGLCGGVLAYNLKAPVILINAGVEQLATEYVEENGISKGVVLGGVNSVKDSSVRTIFDMDSEDIIEEVTYVIEK